MKSGIILKDIFSGFPQAAKKFDCPLRGLCTFKTGGNADLVLTPSSAEQIAHAVSLCREHLVPYAVLGAGSNVLISDKGFSGVIIRMGRDFSALSIEGELMRAQAGASLIALSRAAENAGLTGLEFCSGIPGTLGGGILMNAGAYGGEMSSVTESVTFLREGRLINYDQSSCGFVYRGSIFSEGEIVITGAVLRLKRGDKEQIRTLREEYTARRRASTPWAVPSAGSAFKRPKNDFAARLIEEAGLKGSKIGGAEVSKKHSGFIVNTGNAASADIYRLMARVAETVYKKFGVRLEPEIKFLGEF